MLGMIERWRSRRVARDAAELDAWLRSRPSEWPHQVSVSSSLLFSRLAIPMPPGAKEPPPPAGWADRYVV
jgi:hypothetical protein